ncbi:MAG: hypothetical protein WD270_01265 [Acetobacterales bacterium]
MKLNEVQIDVVQQQVGVEPVPDDNPAVDTLKEHFGDHTFYVGQEGLFVWEEVDREGPEDAAVLVQLASWSEQQPDTLVPHEPQVSELMVDFAGTGAGPDGSAGGPQAA